MSIDAQLFVITGGLAVCSLFATWQAFRLRAIYRSKASWVGAVTFLLWGGRHVYSLTTLRGNIAKSRLIIEEAKLKGVNLRGVTLDHLTGEQWLNIIWIYAIAFGFIWWQHLQHRDLKKLGV